MKAKTKTQKIIDWFVKHPSSDVKVVARKFDAAVPMVYKLRKRAMDSDVVNKALEDMLKMPPMPEPEDTVDTVLNNRGKTYGKFIEGAEIMQMTKRLVRNYIAQRGTELAFDQLEAIDMILHKLGRIINGNPDHTDNWVDIAGYATLVADRLKGNAR
jgi:hypothetical protein